MKSALRSRAGLLVLLVLPLLLSSCATLLNRKTKDVKLKVDSNATVHYWGAERGSGPLLTKTLEHKRHELQVRIEQPGYKPEYTALIRNQKTVIYFVSPLLAAGATVLPLTSLVSLNPSFGLLTLTPTLEIFAQPFDFENAYELENTTPFPKRDKDEKFVYLNGLSLKFKNNSPIYKQEYGDLEALKANNGNPESKAYDPASVDFQEESLKQFGNQKLRKHNYLDTTRIFQEKLNTVFVDLSIDSLQYDMLNNYEVYQGQATVACTLNNIYGDELYSDTLKVESDLFCFDKSGEHSAPKAVRDIIYTVLARVQQQSATQPHLARKTYQEAAPEFSPLTLQQGDSIKQLNEAQRATVTVKPANKAHGSGCVIGRNGYVVTNYHVAVRNKDDLYVRLRNGQRLKATLVRKNSLSDLALLKVDHTFKHTYALPAGRNYSPGTTTYAVGTPEVIKLSKTLTKGIISGVRKHEYNTYLQTDASVNKGSDGGALVNKRGQLLGIITSKVKKFGREGIGFGSPAHLVDERLGLTYPNP